MSNVERKQNDRYQIKLLPVEESKEIGAVDASTMANNILNTENRIDKIINDLDKGVTAEKLQDLEDLLELYDMLCKAFNAVYGADLGATQVAFRTKVAAKLGLRLVDMKKTAGAMPTADENKMMAKLQQLIDQQFAALDELLIEASDSLKKGILRQIEEIKQRMTG